MPVTLVGSGGLFTRLGKLAKVLRSAHSFAGATLGANIDAALAALGTEYNLAAPLAQSRDGILQSVSGSGSVVQQVSLETLLKMVNDDSLQSSRTDLKLALDELIRQMVAASASVAKCTVTSTATASGDNTGTGVCVTTTKRGDGRFQENLFAETATLFCTGDAQSGTATSGQEPFSFAGDQAATDPLGFDWPGASGATAFVQVADSEVASLLANGSFNNFTVANVPDSWTILAGTAGTTVLSEAIVTYRPGKSLNLVGNSSVFHSLAQTMTGLLPNRVYAISCWIRATSDFAAATTFSLVLLDGANATISDDAGTPNVVSANLGALQNNLWFNLSGAFRTPRVLPSTLKVAVRTSIAAIATGQSVYVDAGAMAEASFLYAGGPALKLFAGATPFVVGDRFAVVNANDLAGSTYGGTFHTFFDRAFGMKGLGLLLPSSASPTIADSLIN